MGDEFAGEAKFIEKHPTAKFTYQITQVGRDYLEQHHGVITDQDLKNLDGYEEAWKEASRKKQLAKVGTGSGKNETAQSTPDELIDAAFSDLNNSLAADLLDTMGAMDPYQFEQVVVDLLFAMGYGGSREEAAQVTKKSNDEGIDGVVNEDRLGLDVIYVQAKRWQGTIGRKEIQSFVGALAGQQATKGVFITTSGFVQNAWDYAASVAQRVILIDGQRLAELMIEHHVGVSTVRRIELKRVDTDYFEGE